MVRLSHLISFFVLSRFFLFFFSDSLPERVLPDRKLFGKKEKTKKKLDMSNEFALITLYPFYNTISNTYTHEVVVLWFE